MLTRNLPLLTIVLAMLLGACASIEHDAPIRSWEGVAFGHRYTGSCASRLVVDGKGVNGVWRWPSTIILHENRCKGDDWTLQTLAHEVAHLVECGPDEACARQYTHEILLEGVTLAELGWPD